MVHAESVVGPRGFRVEGATRACRLQTLHGDHHSHLDVERGIDDSGGRHHVARASVSLSLSDLDNFAADLLFGLSKVDI